jgi:hypothetical protein
MTRDKHAMTFKRLAPSPRLTLHGALTIALVAGVPVMTIAVLCDLFVWAFLGPAAPGNSALLEIWSN